MRDALASGDPDAVQVGSPAAATDGAAIANNAAPTKPAQARRTIMSISIPQSAASKGDQARGL